MNGIKITKIETIRPLSHPSSLWIQMHDDQGNIGLGETFFSQSVIEEYVHKIAAPIILNTPLINPELMNLLLRPYVLLASSVLPASKYLWRQLYLLEFQEQELRYRKLPW